MKKKFYPKGYRFPGTNLIYISELPPKVYNSRKSRRALFLCDCGEFCEKVVGSVSNKAARSCGCIKRERMTRHGNSYDDLFDVWRSMISRCYNRNNKAYKNYGGRGITVCERWKCSENGFSNFIEDVGCDYEQGTTLDRVDNNLGYSPCNVQWATLSQQSYNRRPNNRNKSGKKGVCKERGLWIAYITKDRKTYKLGRFENLEDAIEARISAEKRYFGFTLDH